MSWLILAFTIPVFVAWKNGSTYAFAWSIAGAGIALRLASYCLIAIFVKTKLPKIEEDPTGADIGILPVWISRFGLIGTGLVPAGLLVALLLWLGVIAQGPK